MKTVSELGIGLSLVFGCLLLALVAEVYYLFRWKKNKKSKRIMSQESEEEKEEEHNNGYAKDLIQLFCFKKPQSLHPNNGGGGETVGNPDGDFSETQDLELGLMKHLGGDAGFEAEFMKLHNQRFLFTIKEETKEDMESADGKSRKGSRSRTRSLSDLPLGVSECNTPRFFTPLASPTMKSSPSPLESYPNHGFNPLFESEGELEFNRFFRPSSSPPPKFKFLRDAEEKLRRRLMEEAKEEIGGSVSASPKPESLIVTEGSFLKFMNSAMNREEQNLQESHETTSSSSLQVQILEH